MPWWCTSGGGYICCGSGSVWTYASNVVAGAAVHCLLVGEWLKRSIELRLMIVVVLMLVISGPNSGATSAIIVAWHNWWGDVYLRLGWGNVWCEITGTKWWWLRSFSFYRLFIISLFAYLRLSKWQQWGNSFGKLVLLSRSRQLNEKQKNNLKCNKPVWLTK